MAPKPITFSHTRLGTWQRCRQRYEWKYIDRLPETASDGQKRGRAGHKALELWYSGQREHEAATVMGLAELDGLPKEAERMRIILERYFKWASLMDSASWDKVLGTEVELKGEIDGHEFIGYADLIVQTKTGIAIVDHKFSASTGTEGALQSPQLSTYGELCLQTIGEMPEKLIYNVVRTTVGGQAATTPVLRYGAAIVPERHQLWREETAAKAAEIAAFHGQGGPKPAKYRSQTKDCSWDCSFYRRCLALDSGKEYREGEAQGRADLEVEDDVTVAR
jgi:RecB family exonuclease